MVDNYLSINVEPRGHAKVRGQRSDSLFAHFCQHGLVSSDWDVTSMKIFQQLLEGGVSDSEAVDTAGWVRSGVDSSFVNCVCVCVGVKRWEYERTRERCRTAAYWTVMNSYDWQSINKPLKSHCLQNRVHALSNIQHPMMFLIVCHLEDAWNLNKYTNINEKNTAMHHLQWNNCVQECRGTVPSTAETAAELISSCLSWSVLDLLVRTSIGEWVGEKDGAETGWSRTISRPLSKDVVLFSCCLFSSSCNFSSFFLIRCLALLEGLCFFAAATSCVLVVGNDRLFDASLFDGTLRFV